MTNYKELAARGVRGNLSQEEHDFLRTPIALQHWYDALVLTKTGVETQLSSRSAKRAQTRLDFIEQANKSGGTVVMHEDLCKIKDTKQCTCKPFTGDLEEAWLRFKVEQLTWRVRALKFLSAIEEHLCECKALKRQQNDENMRLRSAIKRHKEQMGSEDAGEPDLELWSWIDSDDEPDIQRAVS